jgi:hypothetical protein
MVNRGCRGIAILPETISRSIWGTHEDNVTIKLLCRYAKNLLSCFSKSFWIFTQAKRSSSTTTTTACSICCHLRSISLSFLGSFVFFGSHCQFRLETGHSPSFSVSIYNSGFDIACSTSSLTLLTVFYCFRYRILYLASPQCRQHQRPVLTTLLRQTSLWLPNLHPRYLLCPTL